MPVASLIERLTDHTFDDSGERASALATDYELRLLPDLADPSELPATAERAVLIGRVGESLYLRTFDEDGPPIAEACSASSTGEARRRFDELGRRLATAWPPQKIARPEAERLIRLALALAGPPIRPEVSLREFRESVREDLSWLLNAKRSLRKDSDDLLRTGVDTPDLSSLGELATSLWTYGLPDFTTLTLDNGAHRELLRAHIEETIKRFELRLIVTEVICHPPAVRGRPVHYEILADLKVDSKKVRVRFDSELDLNTKAFVVRAD